MASAFISYSHEDKEFVLALVQALQRQGLHIRYDQVALHIGDSLILAISQEIADGDFLIAVVSPASAKSEWCQKELSLAMTQGIAERRVKVLPVRWREAEMPPMLGDALWADADRDGIEMVARRLAAAMEKHLAGHGGEAARAAEEAPEAQGARRRTRRILETLLSRRSTRLLSASGMCSALGTVSGTAATSATSMTPSAGCAGPSTLCPNSYARPFR